MFGKVSSKLNEVYSSVIDYLVNITYTSDTYAFGGFGIVGFGKSSGLESNLFSHMSFMADPKGHSRKHDAPHKFYFDVGGEMIEINRKDKPKHTPLKTWLMNLTGKKEKEIKRAIDEAQ